MFIYIFSGAKEFWILFLFSKKRLPWNFSILKVIKILNTVLTTLKKNKPTNLQYEQVDSIQCLDTNLMIN